MIVSIKIKSDNIFVTPRKPLTVEYLLIGFKNTLKDEYEIGVVRKELNPIKPTQIFTTINEIIEYLETNYIESDFIYFIQNTLDCGLDLKHGRKLERYDVYKLIDDERNYQDQRWNTNLSEDDAPDKDKPVAEWLNYIEYHLGKSKTADYNLNKEESLSELRKIAALAVRALEIHGCPERITESNISTNSNHILTNTNSGGVDSATNLYNANG